MYIEGASDEPLWYVVHTYSGYENKVKTSLEHVIENRNMQDYFFEIVIPMIEDIDAKTGKAKYKNCFPGYVLIKMILTDETWLLVRNVRGVTSFVGPGSKPCPLSDAEAQALGVEMTELIVDYNVGDVVNIVDGALKGFDGTIVSVSPENQRVKVDVSMFGRNVKADVDFAQIQKLL